MQIFENMHTMQNFSADADDINLRPSQIKIIFIINSGHFVWSFPLFAVHNSQVLKFV